MIALFGDTNTATGFRLAGVRNSFAVKSGEDAKNEIKTLLRKEKISLIIVTEKIASDIKSFLNDISSKGLPAVVIIPDISGPISQEDTIDELMVKAIGMKIAVK